MPGGLRKKNDWKSSGSLCLLFNLATENHLIDGFIHFFLLSLSKHVVFYLHCISPCAKGQGRQEYYLLSPSLIMCLSQSKALIGHHTVIED